MTMSIRRVGRRSVLLGAVALAAGTARSRPAQGVTPTAPQPGAQPMASTPLQWGPPQLVDPVPIQLGTGVTSNTLDDNTDYIIKLPDAIKTGATILRGGNNIVIMGGHIRLPTYDPEQSTGLTRAIYIKDNQGAVHIEGVLIDAVSDGYGDAIVIASPNSIVQVENVRVEHLTGSYGTIHADVIQPSGGVKTLRVDRLTASSNYQGLFLRRDKGDIGSVVVKHANLVADEELEPGALGGYMVWLSPDGANSTGEGPTYNFWEVYVQPRAGRSIGKSVWPDEDDAVNPVVVSPGGYAEWPTLSNVTRGVHEGAPADGDFVPEGVAGLNYVSPRYQ